MTKKNKLLNWLRYPIKLLLVKKVAEYKHILIALRFMQEHTMSKHRREGATDKAAWNGFMQMLLISKYQEFVNKWEIKKSE